MVAGGPNADASDCAKKYIDKDAYAKSYYDNSCSYATNEVAINWNAPFAYVIGSLQAIASTGQSYDVKTPTAAKIPPHTKCSTTRRCIFSSTKSIFYLKKRDNRIP